MHSTAYIRTHNINNNRQVYTVIASFQNSTAKKIQHITKQKSTNPSFGDKENKEIVCLLLRNTFLLLLLGLKNKKGYFK